MTPELAGQVCDRLDQSLRGSEINLTAVADTLVVVLRDEAWRCRRIRTGEIVECQSFLELLTAPPLRGFGEDPKKVEALLKDDVEALRLFRAATTRPKHKHHDDGDNITIKPRRGTDRSYTLTRLRKADPILYQRVVDGELSAHAAAIEAGLRKRRTPLEQLEHWWAKTGPDDRATFLRSVGCP